MGGFVIFQQWLRSLDLTAYSLDYPGYGASEGWPNEARILADAETVAEKIIEREKIKPQELIIVGLSIGTGPAAYVAAKYQSRVLALISPYETLAARAREEFLLGFLAPILRYEFDNAANLSKLSNSCVILAHGEDDNIIKPEHSTRLAKHYKGTPPVNVLLISNVGHNDIIKAHKIIGEQIVRCVEALRGNLASK